MKESGVKGELLSSFDERYRLYVDESGDHVYRELDAPGHRYLCLLGCWIQGKDYREFHSALDELKQRHFPHNPDEPVILHRYEIRNRQKSFWRLRSEEARRAFDADLIDFLGSHEYKMVGVVIDKKSLKENYEVPAHPYHLAMGFLLQRYCGFLNHMNRVGDVMAESRGGRENRLLMDSFERVHQRGVWQTRKEYFQRALTSGKLKIKQKSANIAGLQLADLLAHPVRQYILRRYGLLETEPGRFERRIMETIVPKFNRHLYEDRMEGYGHVLFPKQ